ncbi:MAG: hypothetical protein JW715_07305 [Sedimentisphaerales bacterium]|nr:hypothetical protein [Sedimentisphaerales bacterium]
MRKILILLVSFAVVVGTFLLYGLLDNAPPLDAGRTTDFIGAVDSNLARFSDANNIGQIDGVGIGPSEKARYFTRGENGEITGEYGFEVLLYKKGEIWELKKPYRYIYKPEFKCYMTADNGSFEIEDAAGSTTLKDATFIGNVVIRIIPGDKGDFKETTIYLDDLVFLSDKSQLATNGPVRLVSENVNMYGTGMELIFNDVMNRLEFFRVFDLESLVFRILKTALDEQKQTELPAETAGEAAAAHPEETMVAVTDSNEPEQEQKQFYKCLFARNVLIDRPEQLIFAGQEVLINDIFWAKDANKDDSVKTVSYNDANETGPVVAGPNEPVFAFAEPNEPNQPDEEFVEVTIICDGGFIVTPSELAINVAEFEQPLDDARRDIISEVHEKAGGRTTLITEKIEYNALMEDADATGSTELTFYIKDANSTDPNQQSVPVRVTAQKQVSFLKALNQAVFEGDCMCTMPQRDLTVEKDLTLSSPRLTVDLGDYQSRQPSKLPDIIAAGPAELVFYVEDSNAAKAQNAPLPVKITAQKQARYLSESDKVIFEGDCICKMGSDETSKDQNFEMKSPMLTVNMPAEKTNNSFAVSDIVAAGPAELEFFVDDITGTKESGEALPAKVFAKKNARFLSSTKQVIFTGPCRSTIVCEDPNYIEEFTLVSELMTVDLPKDANSELSSSTTRIKHLVAEGGVVRLAATKRTNTGKALIQGKESENDLGGIEIECTRVDYDSQQEMFLASGPARIDLSNTQSQEPNEKRNGFGQGKKWWASVEDCNNLKYMPKENRIIADSLPGKILSVEYISIENGQLGPTVFASAGHADIVLTENPEGKTELSTLLASGGVEYNTEKGDKFIGNELFYEQEKSLIKVKGSETQPCYYNGVLVDGIEYNLKTGEVKSKIVAPGALQIGGTSNQAETK